MEAYDGTSIPKSDRLCDRAILEVFRLWNVIDMYRTADLFIDVSGHLHGRQFSLPDLYVSCVREALKEFRQRVGEDFCFPAEVEHRLSTAMLHSTEGGVERATEFIDSIKDPDERAFFVFIFAMYGEVQ